MEQLPHDQIKPFSESGEKKAQVSAMFDEIAPKYDFLNRFLSAGIDKSWRKKAINQFKNDAPKRLLDVATGTADMAIRACKMLDPEKIIGIDISPKMLEIGRQKVEKERLTHKIELIQGDSEAINQPDVSFDGVMVAFGVRNFSNLRKGLSEIFRVLKPGGRLVVLEFSKPRIPGLRNMYHLYMRKIAPQVAGWFRQNKKAYVYLNRSAEAFPDRHDFIEIMRSIGYSDSWYKPLSLGICCIYVGRKPHL
jgi:demethylmenaquinone methyltransferase/2-methoxy-6-polyprenyl-1,4-benzoquinol methylase